MRESTETNLRTSLLFHSYQSQYIYMCDKVLRELADVLEAERKRRRLTNVKESRQFVRRCEATAGHVRATRRTSVLDRDQREHDWQYEWTWIISQFSLANIVDTNLTPQTHHRHTVCVTSVITVLSVELTMLWEEHREKANERKSFKYTNLMVDRRIDDCANLITVSC